MHKCFLSAVAVLCLALIAASPPVVHAQSKAGPFTINSSSSPCATISVTGQSTVAISVSGTFSATLQPEVSITGRDGSTGTPANTQVTPSTSSTAQSTITAVGVYSGSVSGYDTFLVCVTAYTSGTATIYLNATKATAGGNGSGGSGSGTVSANSGSAGAVANYAAAGGSTTVGPDQTLIDNGTNWVSTEPIQVPVGAAATPSIPFTGHLASGYFWTSGHGPSIGDSSTPMMIFDSNQGDVVADGNTLCFSPNANGASCDTNLVREAANLLGVGSSEVALIRPANICRITADVSLTVNTANSFCSFSLPALAKAWGWHCDVIWAISAGTGTNTFSLGVNASQTPTAATNAAATILTTQTGTQTQGVAALSASGAVNVLTSPTYTPAATLQQATATGNVLASATAGTFAITATAAGTTATAAIKAGTTCNLY